MPQPENSPTLLPGLSPIAALLVLALLMMLGNGIGNGLAYLLGQGAGLSYLEVIENFDKNSPMPERNFLRAINFFAQFFTFTVPPLLLAFMLYKKNWMRFLRLHAFPPSNTLVAGIAFIIGIFVFSQFAYWLNKQLPLPPWATGLEASASRMVEGILRMETPWEFILTLFVVAVLPAVGEELVFRGILQQKIEEATAKPALSIWVAALLFSAFHLQFEGLLPRALLGAGLGYLFYWTRSLWAPMLAHFTINGLQIAGQYYKSENLAESSLQEVNWTATAVSVVLVAGLSYYLYRHNHNRETEL